MVTEPVLLNASLYPCEVLALSPPEREGEVTVLAKATFDIVPGGRAEPAAEQEPLLGADALHGEGPWPEVLYESDFVPFKPVADALCVGRAHAPRGEPVTQLPVGFEVAGAFRKLIHVFGPRRWTSGVVGFGVKPTAPEPFDVLDVSYRNAYGGPDLGKPNGHRFYLANPLGKGYSKNGAGLTDAPVPNLEDPQEPLKSWRTRPAPAGFGPIGRTWSPRAQRAGTFGEVWARAEPGSLPRDFDPRFFNSAPDDQQIQGYLRGDEAIRVLNMHPEHPDLSFTLPGHGPQCLKAIVRGDGEAVSLEPVPWQIDTLWVDMETLRCILAWRALLNPRTLSGVQALLCVEGGSGSPAEHLATYHALWKEQADDGEEESMALLGEGDEGRSEG